MTEKFKIEPAFLRDDWGAIMNGGGVPATCRPADAQHDPHELARTIAHANHLLPDSDPRKITRYWVDTLRTEARYGEYAERMGDNAAFRDDPATLRQIADALASYLPPE